MYLFVGTHIGNPIVSHQVANENSQQYSLLEGTGDNSQFSRYYTHSFQSPFEEKNGMDQKKGITIFINTKRENIYYRNRFVTQYITYLNIW